MKSNQNKKLKLGIFDFTDCEGCQVQIISLREKILEFEKVFDIINWRLGQEKKFWGHFDIALIEGTPLTQEEIEILKYLRENSTFLIGLGSCATLGGIPGIMDKELRKFWYEKIYSKDYKPKGIDALPISAYVKADFLIHGCPVEKKELLRAIEDIAAGKKPSYRDFSVCFDCKLAANPCRLLSKKPCLGPITQGGCKAVCVSGGSPCYGCFGLREEANIKALIKILRSFANEDEIKRYFSMFLKKTYFNI